jgi:hypothetical protein
MFMRECCRKRISLSLLILQRRIDLPGAYSLVRASRWPCMEF